MLLAVLILSFANLALGAALGWRLEERINALDLQLRKQPKRENDWQLPAHERANFARELAHLSPEQLAAYREALAYHAGGMPADH